MTIGACPYLLTLDKAIILKVGAGRTGLFGLSGLSG